MNIDEQIARYDAAREHLDKLADEAAETGDHSKYDETRTDYSEDAFDVLGSVLALFRTAARPATASQDPRRTCLRCHVDLSDRMGVTVFVYPPVRESIYPKPMAGLLCVEHGSNGANGMDAQAYAALVAALPAHLREALESP